jgi:hypothetical protein
VVPDSISEKNLLRWFTRDSVGTSIVISLSSRNSTATFSTTIVFPKPVGKMTRVLHQRHPGAIAVWHLPFSILSGMMRECDMKLISAD